MAKGGNLVLSLLILGGSGIAVWAGITDPQGGVRDGLASLMRGEPTQAKPRGSFLSTMAALSSGPDVGPSTGKGKGGPYSLGAVQPHVSRAAAEVGPLFGIRQILGYGERDNATDHDDGLALDFMVSDARGTALSRYVMANRRRLGVTYVIWRQRINSGDGRGWRAMEDRGSRTANHMDHVHVSFAPRGVSA